MTHEEIAVSVKVTRWDGKRESDWRVSCMTGHAGTKLSDSTHEVITVSVRVTRWDGQE